MDDSPLGRRIVSLELLRQQVHEALNPDLDGSEFIRPDRAALLDPFVDAPADIQAANMQRVADGLPPFHSGNEVNSHFLSELPPEHAATWEVPDTSDVVFGDSSSAGYQATASGNIQDPPTLGTAAPVPEDVETRLADYSEAMYNHHLSGFASAVSSLESQSLDTDSGVDIQPIGNLESQEQTSEPNSNPQSRMWTDMPADMTGTLEPPYTGNPNAIEYTTNYDMNVDQDDSSGEDPDESAQGNPASDPAPDEDEVASLPVERPSEEEMMNFTMDRPRLVMLPLNVFGRICDYLPWSAKELLGRTCTVMRQRLHKTCKEVVSRMGREEHLVYQSDISQTMQVHVACADCGRLHRATIGDVPILCYRSPNRTCPAKLMALPRSPDLCVGYCLEYHHVQLALKLRRQGLFMDHVNAILQPYHMRTRDQGTFTSVEAFVRPILTIHEVEPSFMVFKALEFVEYGAAYARSLSPQTIRCLAICPHATLAERDPEKLRSNVIFLSICDARNGLITRHNYSCAVCPTDISIHTLPDRVRIYAWHDFGREGTSPVDNAWRVHIGGPGSNPNEGPPRFQPRGSVRLRYETARLQQPPNRLTAENSNTQSTLNTWALREEAIVNFWNLSRGQMTMQHWQMAMQQGQIAMHQNM